MHMFSTQKTKFPRCFLEINPAIWHTCSMSPYPAVDERFFFFFLPDILNLSRPKYLTPPKKKLTFFFKILAPFVNDLSGAHRTRVPGLRVSPKNGVDVRCLTNLARYAWPSLYSLLSYISLFSPGILLSHIQYSHILYEPGHSLIFYHIISLISHEVVLYLILCSLTRYRGIS